MKSKSSAQFIYNQQFNILYIPITKSYSSSIVHKLINEFNFGGFAKFDNLLTEYLKKFKLNYNHLTQLINLFKY